MERDIHAESVLQMTPHHIQPITRKELEAAPGQMRTWENFIAFVDVRDGWEFAEWIAQNAPNAHLQSALAPGDRLHGYLVTDMQFDATMNIGLSHGLRDLWNSPARGILAACGMGIAAILLGQKTIIGQLPNKK